MFESTVVLKQLWWILIHPYREKICGLNW